MKFRQPLTVALLTVLGLLPAKLASAQADAVVTNVQTLSPQFFVCVIAGVLLALGFHLLLTNLSVAAGVSAVGDLEKHTIDTSTTNQRGNAPNTADPDSSSAIVKISNGMGVWALITVSLSLFFASLLAVKLSLIPDNTVGITLGLVIWASYYAIMMYMEAKTVKTLTGAIWNTAVSGLRNGFKAVSGTFSTSSGKEMEDAAKASIHELRKELVDVAHKNDIDKKMDKWVKELKPQQPDYSKIEDKLKKLLDDVELKETMDTEGDEVVKKIFLDLASEQPAVKKEDVKKMGDAFDKVRSVAKSKGSTGDKVRKGIDKLTPGSEEQTRQMREKIEEYLKSTGKEELQPETIMSNLEKMAKNPKEAPRILSEHASHFDRDTIVSLVAQQDSMNREKAEKMADKVEQAFAKIKGKAGQMQDSAQHAASSAQEQMGKAGSDGRHQGDGSSIRIEKKSSAEVKSKVEAKVRDFFDEMGRKEFDYDMMKRDFMRIIHDPKATPDVLKERLKMYDRDSLIVLLSHKTNMSREDAERTATKLVEGRDEVMKKVDEIEEQVTSKMQLMKRKALEEAEEVRKAAAAAAWWFFFTALISGAAAALGGAMALTFI